MAQSSIRPLTTSKSLNPNQRNLVPALSNTGIIVSGTDGIHERLCFGDVVALDFRVDSLAYA